MGILNVTPDSFFDGGRFSALDAAKAQVSLMLEQGAHIIDIGGMSSRPGAEIIDSKEELTRIRPVIEMIKKDFPEALISVDTIHSETIRSLHPLGIDLVNDISAGAFDPKMFETVADLQMPYILMHMAGQPTNMQNAPQYEDVCLAVLDFFIAKVGQLRSLGCKDLIIDPGFGFGKSIAHNYKLLKKMHIFSTLGLPILTGISRKSMIYKLLDITAQEALNGTSVLHLVALQQGSRILRVHDVKPAAEVIRLWQQLEIQ
ncbi:MAG: dihydropteroate synthase [Saprospiraceae bacterium]